MKSPKNSHADVNVLNSVKQAIQYFIKLWLFDKQIIFKKLETVLLPFHHYCHNPATQPQVCWPSLQSCSWCSTLTISAILIMCY